MVKHASFEMDINVLVTGEHEQNKSELLALFDNSIENARYYMVYDGKEIDDLERFQGRRGQPLSDRKTAGLRVGRDIMGDPYRVHVVDTVDKADAVIIVAKYGTDYTEQYMQCAMMTGKRPVVVLHTSYQPSDSEKNIAVDELKRCIERECRKNNAAALEDVPEEDRDGWIAHKISVGPRPVHSFIDFDADLSYPYRDYMKNKAFQDMLNTIQMLRIRVKRK